MHPALLLPLQCCTRFCVMHTPSGPPTAYSLHLLVCDALHFMLCALAVVCDACIQRSSYRLHFAFAYVACTCLLLLAFAAQHQWQRHDLHRGLCCVHPAVLLPLTFYIVPQSRGDYGKWQPHHKFAVHNIEVHPLTMSLHCIARLVLCVHVELWFSAACLLAHRSEDDQVVIL